MSCALRFNERRIVLPSLNWWIRVLTITSLLVVSGVLFAQRYSIGINPQVMGCIPGRVFLVDHRDRSPQCGQIFAYRSGQAAPVYADGTLMAKYLAAGPGDTVEVTEDFRILVNDHLFARGLPHLKGLDPKALKAFVGRRVLAADQYWMLGTLPMSFDSRYWGPIHGDQIVGRAYVLF